MKLNRNEIRQGRYGTFFIGPSAPDPEPEQDP